MDNNELAKLDDEKKYLKSTAEYYLSNVFHKTLQNKYIPIIKPGIQLSNIIELFNCLFPRKNLNLKQLAILINTMYSLFCAYPPLIQLIHSLPFPHSNCFFLMNHIFQVELYSTILLSLYIK